MSRSSFEQGAVGQKLGEHLREAWAIRDRVRTAHRRVVERGDDVEAGRLGVGLD
jgi:hypothetical protein